MSKSFIEGYHNAYAEVFDTLDKVEQDMLSVVIPGAASKSDDEAYKMLVRTILLPVKMKLAEKFGEKMRLDTKNASTP